MFWTLTFTCNHSTAKLRPWALWFETQTFNHEFRAVSVASNLPSEQCTRYNYLPVSADLYAESCLVVLAHLNETTLILKFEHSSGPRLLCIWAWSWHRLVLLHHKVGDRSLLSLHHSLASEWDLPITNFQLKAWASNACAGCIGTLSKCCGMKNESGRSCRLGQGTLLNLVRAKGEVGIETWDFVCLCAIIQ